MAIHHNGALFDQSSKGDGVYWLDPTNKDSWDYILEIVKEVINFGIDEIQFDYVRFPESNLYEYELLNEEKERREYIEEFLAYIRRMFQKDNFIRRCFWNATNIKKGLWRNRPDA